MPTRRDARFRVSKIDHQMSIRDQLLWIGRVAVLLQVARRGCGKNSRVQQSSGDESGWARLAEANSQIVSIRDQISEAFPCDQVHLKLRICFEKSTELRSENELREVRVDVDAESPPDGDFTFGQSGGGVFERRHNRANGLVKPPAFVREGDGASRRSRSRIPTCASSRATAWLMPGWETFKDLAAAGSRPISPLLQGRSRHSEGGHRNSCTYANRL
jgi:hypothetical protein